MQVKDDRVDAMIAKLLEVRGKKPGKNVQLSEDDIKHLCTKSRELFISQPNLLELEAPIKICGKSQTRSALMPDTVLLLLVLRSFLDNVWRFESMKMTHTWHERVYLSRYDFNLQS